MKKGFTLVEVLVAVLVFAVLLGFTVPKFISLIHKAQEGSTKHQLVRLRSAIYPTDNLNSLIPRYIEAIPQANIPGVDPSNAVSAGTYDAAFTKKGGWAYVSDPADPRFGDVFVNSDQEDSYGKAWHTH